MRAEADILRVLDGVDSYRFTIHDPIDHHVRIRSEQTYKIQTQLRSFIDAYLSYETTVPEAVVAEQLYSIRYFNRLASRYNLSLGDPLILYVDKPRMEREGKIPIDKTYSNIDIGTALCIGPLVIVYVNPAGELALQIAEKTHHELAHYYALHQVRIRQAECFLYGGACIYTATLRPGGALFEEAYALNETEAYLHLRGSWRFPKDYVRLWYHTLQTPDRTGVNHYLSTTVFDATSTPPVTFLRSDLYLDIYIMLSKRISKFQSRMVKARMTGNWSGLGKSIDESFSPGTFATLAGINKHTISLAVLQAAYQYLGGHIALKDLRTTLKHEEEATLDFTTETI